MNSIDDWYAIGRQTGRRLAVMPDTVNVETFWSRAETASARRTSVSIWFRATRAAWVARKNSSFSLITRVDEWNAVAIAVRSIDVIASEISTSTMLRPRRAAVPRRGAAVGGREVIGAPCRWR